MEFTLRPGQLKIEDREHVPFYEKDRYFAPDIAAVKAIIQRGNLKILVR